MEADKKQEKEFKVFTLQTVEEGTKNYVHWSEGLSMYITKDGVTIKLDSEEIQQVVKALPRTVGGTY
jgi:hypothetical protein